MFSFLKRKLAELFGRTKQELQQEAKEEESKLKQEIQIIAQEEVEQPEKKEKLEQEKKGLIAKIKKAFTTTKLDEVKFERFFAELEIMLLENNVALEAIDFLRSELKKELINKEISLRHVEAEIKAGLEKALLALLREPFDLVKEIKAKDKKPYVIVFFGINGAGKTLSIAKLAYMLRQNQLSCVLAASDTFRAAAIEQLAKHAQALNIEMIRHSYGADPAAVAYDAIAHAKARAIDVVLIDTAGRMHIKADLMREMQKICRVTKPDLKIFVGEAIAGSDVIEQAKAFNDSVGIDGIILTKADVDERGGACISISYVTGKPILYLGTGQKLTDLKGFDKEELLENILG